MAVGFRSIASQTNLAPAIPCAMAGVFPARRSRVWPSSLITCSLLVWFGAGSILQVFPGNARLGATVVFVVAGCVQASVPAAAGAAGAAAGGPGGTETLPPGGAWAEGGGATGGPTGAVTLPPASGMVS